jgi:two-component system chemotaxis response regulator CheY
MAAHSVLVVEDHDELRLAIAALLVRAGYVVSTARDAEEAVAELASMARPCLVLWDPVSSRMSLSLLSQVAFDGIRIATIPVGIAPAAAGQEAATPGYTKKLTSRQALLSVVREHCPDPETV